MLSKLGIGLFSTYTSRMMGQALLRGFGNYQKERASVHRGEITDLKPNTLFDIPGAKKKNVKELGRGRSSGKGKTSGKGNKGQGARNNKKHPRFEGGQNPLYKRFPKIKLETKNVWYEDVWLGKIAYAIQRGWLDPSKLITIYDMYKCGIICKPKYGVLLQEWGSEWIRDPIQIEVSDTTPEAYDALKALDGKIRIKYRNIIAMHEHCCPEKIAFPSEEPFPPYNEVKKLLELEEMGCEVDFRRADWVGEIPKGRELLIKATEGFEYPVRPYPGMAADRIRKRKIPYERTVKFKFIK